jgi:hypothetical protein
MSQLLRAMGLGVLMLALVVGVGISGDTKKDKDTGKKAGIPTGWKALKLSKEQHDKVVTIAMDYRARIAVLEKQIDDLKAQQRVEQVKVLTSDQKAMLLKGLTGETKDKAPAKDTDK